MEERTKIILQIGDMTTTWERPIWDPTAYDLVEAFTGMCVAQTFHKDTMLRAMYEYLEEQGYYGIEQKVEK